MSKSPSSNWQLLISLLALAPILLVFGVMLFLSGFMATPGHSKMVELLWGLIMLFPFWLVVATGLQIYAHSKRRYNLILLLLAGNIIFLLILMALFGQI